MSAPQWIDTEELRLDRNGNWLSNGAPVTHQPQIDAFFRGIGHDDQGWFIRVGSDFKRVEVEDTGYFVTGLEGDPTSGYTLRLSDGSRERLEPSTLRYSPNRLSCRIRGGKEEAKFLVRPYLEILGELEEDLQAYFVTIEGRRIDLARK